MQFPFLPKYLLPLLVAQMPTVYFEVNKLVSLALQFHQLTQLKFVKSL